MTLIQQILAGKPNLKHDLDLPLALQSEQHF